ncbi:HAD family hydrolase [Rhodobacteraceae bacterium]|nr:HAD family hydrolase [Paracoccaceae bacterium]
MKIAMWSGPRNLSTAMMYSFGNRVDFDAWDEPFYAAYLAATGIDHPMRKEILSGHDGDADEVAQRIRDCGTNIYMKHMAFHMVEGFPLDWAEDCVNVHLIRHPARVVASYLAKRENPTLRDIGFQQQAEIFDLFPGPVVDSADVRRDPETSLRSLCVAIDLPFDPAMLAWDAGPRQFDGVWAAHWYGSVHRSTGFAGEEGPLPKLDGDAQALVNAALPFYDRLSALAI